MSETKKQAKMSICPAKKTVVIRRHELSNNNLAVVTTNPPQIGEVISFGEGKKPVEFKVGSLITYRQFGEFEFFVNNETVYFVKFVDILGVLEKKKGCCKD